VNKSFFLLLAHPSFPKQLAIKQTVVFAGNNHMHATIICLQKSLWLKWLFFSSYILLRNTGTKFGQYIDQFQQAVLYW